MVWLYSYKLDMLLQTGEFECFYKFLPFHKKPIRPAGCLNNRNTLH